MKQPERPINFSKVKLVIYHLPGGKSYAVPVEGLEQFMELGYGRICDNSDIDGVVHYFPQGNA